jgi:hypothetical protein
MHAASNPERGSREFEELEPLSLPVTEHEAWRRGELAPQWHAQYPQLFDDDDLRLARNRWKQGRHYYEWAAARHLHAVTGWSALVAKYEFGNHERKRAIARRLLQPEVMAVLTDRDRYGHAQAPDLLLFAPDESDFLFCEVKGPGDRLRPAQRSKFAALAAVTGKPVRLLRCALHDAP